jgi:hypothetical protein
MEKEMGGACNMYGEEENANTVLVEKSEKTPHAKSNVNKSGCQRNGISTATSVQGNVASSELSTPSHFSRLFHFW